MTTLTPNTPAVAQGLPGPHTAPLDPELLGTLRTALQENRSERRAFLQSLTAEDLQAMENDPAAAAQLDAARRAVADADAALARVDAGTYGACVHCGGPIPAARLEFRPTAAGCVPCTQRAGAALR
ncbi:TraR/DksA family transcriptional regulator [Kineococcus sp. SYSU DK002]|uniref:TraR/DksA family transcriptional regulator n=1 Tax=Kineococcus sp. SYSU DK002 TaxID=3383123 RepID=UPI003D7DF92C